MLHSCRSKRRPRSQGSTTRPGLSRAGVRVYSHLEDREVLLDTPTDKFLMSAMSFAAEVERVMGRQGTYEALVR